jgi:hypothetical protein
MSKNQRGQTLMNNFSVWRNKNQQDALFYSQFVYIINLYTFRAGLLLIIRRYLSVYTANGMCGAENNEIM